MASLNGNCEIVSLFSKADGTVKEAGIVAIFSTARLLLAATSKFCQSG